LPGLTVITDLPSALAAIRTIVEQGEGSSERSKCSHYDRFVGIQEEWARLKQNNEDFQAAWPAATSPVMRKPAQPSADRVWVTDRVAAEVLDSANATYALMLSCLEQAYAPNLSKDMRKNLVAAAMALMTAVSSAARKLARLPATVEYPTPNAGMTFAVPRNLRPRVPQIAVSLLLERIAILRVGLSQAVGFLEGPLAEADEILRR
jgi:hypothetical protein